MMTDLSNKGKVRDDGESRKSEDCISAASQATAESHNNEGRKSEAHNSDSHESESSEPEVRKTDENKGRKNTPSSSSFESNQSETQSAADELVKIYRTKSIHHPNSPYASHYQEDPIYEAEMRLTRQNSVMNPSAWTTGGNRASAAVDVERDAGIGSGRRVRGVMFSEESFDEYTSGDGCERRYTLKRVERPAPAITGPVRGQRAPGLDFGEPPSSSKAAPIITGPARGKPMAGFEFGEPPSSGRNPYQSTTTHGTDPTLSTNTLFRAPSPQTYTVTITTNHDLPLAQNPELHSRNPIRRFLARTRLRRAARERELRLQAGHPPQNDAPRMELWRKMAVVISVVLVILVSTAIAGALVATTSLKERPYGQFRGEVYPQRGY